MKTRQHHIHHQPTFFKWRAFAFITMLLVLSGATGWATVETFTTSITWTCPPGVTTVTVECWGAGGAGGSARRTSGAGGTTIDGGGGAGGAYVMKTNIPVTPGNQYAVVVGAGGLAPNTTTFIDGSRNDGADSWFSNSVAALALAKGGGGGENKNTVGSAAGAHGSCPSGSVGDAITINLGGNGADGTTAPASGGGGGSGGTGVSNPGNPATGTIGGSAVTGGGAGANGRISTGTGSTPTGVGGGGSGAQSGSTTQQQGGSGAPGKVVITYPGLTYTWVATSGSNDWTAAASWSPSRTAPATNDVLLFDLGGSSTATNVPTQMIGKLQVSISTTVALQPTNGASILTIIEPAADALTVAAGSQLDISGATGLTNLTINVATGAKGSISGSMTFFDDFASPTSFTLTAADAGGIMFNSGATFTQNCVGNVFGSSGTASTIIFAPGSKFVSQFGNNPFGLSQPNSKVVFQSGSTYSHQQSASPPSFSGRTYADFEFNANATASGSGSGALTISNLSVVQGTLTLGMNQYSQKGNVTVSGGAALNFNLTNMFNGSSEQIISGAGAFAFGPNAVTTIASGSILTLNLQTNLALSSGILFTDSGTLNIKSALTGTGTINGGGSVAVFPSGTLAPGTASTFGTLTFATAPTLNGTNFVKIDRNGGSPLADEIVLSSGTLNYGGKLIVTNIGLPLQVNDTFTLFSAPSLAGSFSAQLPSGYTWDTSQLNASGTIKVTAISAGGPLTISGIAVSGTNIALNATGGTANGPVTVLTSTNLTLLLAQWLVATNGNFDPSGNFSCTLTNGFSPNTPQQFYLLKTQ